MSKTCYECENCIYTPMCDNTLCPISDETFAEMCGGFTPIQKSPKTLFDRITASPEVLAEKLVYAVSYHWEMEFRYTSNLIPGHKRFDTKDEAIAATVAKLKEVAE